MYLNVVRKHEIEIRVNWPLFSYPLTNVYYTHYDNKEFRVMDYNYIIPIIIPKFFPSANNNMIFFHANTLLGIVHFWCFVYMSAP